MSYCTSCGSPIPDGQGRSCSMCYGDPNHGNDGHYNDWIQSQYEQEMFRRQAEQERRDQQDEGASS